MSSRTTVHVQSIFPNPDQPRKAFDAEALGELVDSIREHGLLQPLVVTSRRDDAPKRIAKLSQDVLRFVDLDKAEWMIVAGERRWRALSLLAQEGGDTSVPVIIRELSEEQVFDLALTENLNREDMNPMEEAHAFEKVMATTGRTVREMAAHFGKSESFVRGRLSLLTLTPEMQNMVEGGHLAISVAIAISRLTNRGQHMVVKAMNDENLTAAEAVKLADNVFENEAQGSLFDLADYMQERAAAMAAEYLKKVQGVQAKAKEIAEAALLAVSSLTKDALEEHIAQCQQLLVPALSGASEEDEEPVPCGVIVSPRCDECPWAEKLYNGDEPCHIHCAYLSEHPGVDPIEAAEGCPHPLDTLAEREQFEGLKAAKYQEWTKGRSSRTFRVGDALLVRAAELPNATGPKSSADPVLLLTIERSPDTVIAAVVVRELEDGGTALFIDADHGGPDKHSEGGAWHKTYALLQAGHTLYDLAPGLDLDSVTKLYRDEEDEAAED